MNSAYLYVRVSTDEQKRKGFSLIEQEDRLLKHCEMNRIEVKGVFREDCSAKDFNRPEWKNLIKMLKRDKHRPSENILFVKWDRFSRNIEYAYQMLGVLRGLNVQAVAIDQPIDFEVPESIVTLAVYLSIPEAENSRRGKNTSDGMRRARKMGRWPAKAPVGYVNKVSSDGKKIIVPKQPEAGYVRWAFEEYSKGGFTISHIRRMANIKGLKCGRNNFWRMLHNPFYYGVVTVPENKMEKEEMVRGIHEPLVSERLFKEVQCLLNNMCRRNLVKKNMKPVFLLRGFLYCPFCGRRLTASTSKGRLEKYRYYHCVSRCKGRFRADALEEDYEVHLSRITIRPGVFELLELILEDENSSIVKQQCLKEHSKLLESISGQEFLLSKIRRHFVEDKIDLEDFNDLKNEYKEVLNFYNEQLKLVNERLASCQANKEIKGLKVNEINVLDLYKSQDPKGRGYLIEMFRPFSIDPLTKELCPLQISNALSTITTYKGCHKRPIDVQHLRIMERIPDNRILVVLDRKITHNQAMKVLMKNGIETSEESVKEILNFLYLFATMLPPRNSTIS